MRQITVNLEDGEMAALLAMAQASRTAPEDIVASHIKAFIALIHGPIADAEPNVVADVELAARRAARKAALMGSQGIWEGEPGKPKDGVKYQEEMRAEWQ